MEWDEEVVVVNTQYYVPGYSILFKFIPVLMGEEELQWKALFYNSDPPVVSTKYLYQFPDVFTV